MKYLYNYDFDNIVKGLNELSSYSGFKDDIVNLLKKTVDLLTAQDSYIKVLIQNNKALRCKNSILSRNADTAFQDGLNESRELYKSEVMSEICNEFADKLKAKAECQNYTDIDTDGKSLEYEYFYIDIDDIDEVLQELVCKNNTSNVTPKWQKHYKSGTTVSDGFVSSCCDMWNERKTPYCPHCGAKMDIERKEEE